MDKTTRPGAWTRRQLLTAMGLGVGGLYLAGCGPSKSAGSASGTAAGNGAAATGKDVTLRMFQWASTPEESQAWRGLADMVTKKYPNIKIEMETLPFGQYYDKLKTQLASGTEADIVVMQSFQMPTYASLGALQPLDPFIQQDKDLNYGDFFKVIQDGLTAKGKVYALAYDLGPLVMYYNRDMFKAAGVPEPDDSWTWDTFLDAAKRLTKDGKYGTYARNHFEGLLQWIWQNGGDFMNKEQTACTLDRPEAVEALQWYADLIHKHKVAPQLSDPGNIFAYREAYYAGKIGMLFDGPWAFFPMRNKCQFDWDIALPPKGKANRATWVAGSGYAMSRHTKHPQETWQAIKTITSSEGLGFLADLGRAYPGRQSALPKFIKPDLKPAKTPVVEKQLSGDGRAFITTTTWQETLAMINRELDPVMISGKPAKDAMAAIKPQFDQLLQKHQQNMAKA